MNDHLFSETNERHNLLPIQYDDIWQLRQDQVANHWVLQEIDLSEDKVQWPTLDSNAKNYIKRILSFFSTVDSVLLKSMGDSKLNDITIPEIKSFLIQMEAIEDIHNESYNFMVESLISDSKEKRTIYEALFDEPIIKAKANYAMSLMEDDDIGVVLVGQAIFEQLFISASFVPFFWFRKQGIMPGLSMINELASRDENLHGQFASLVYRKMLLHTPAPDEVREMILGACEIELEFTDWALPVNLLGMNRELMKKYVMFITDRLLADFNLSPEYNESNPFPWMEMVGMETKTNFFEQRTGEYRRVTEESGMVFDADF